MGSENFVFGLYACPGVMPLCWGFLLLAQRGIEGVPWQSVYYYFYLHDLLSSWYVYP
jgi:hypothetical protein